jgi:replicative DNA helicase
MTKIVNRKDKPNQALEANNEVSIYRVQPSNLLAEQILLGNFLVNNELIYKVTNLINAEDFFDPVHGRIYNAILAMLDRGVIANPVTLKNQFDKDEALKDAEGGVYLAKLASLAANIINVVDYARIISDLSLRRKLIAVGEDIVNDAYANEEEISANEQIERAEQELFSLDGTIRNTNSFAPLKISLEAALAKAQLAYKNKDDVTGISTGFIDLDSLLGGFQNSDLIILAARPSMGKTALSINFALNCCQYLLKSTPEGETPKAVGYFSLEMSSEQLATRLLSMMSTINATKIRTGHVTEDDFSKIILASKELSSLPIYIDDTPSLSISALRTRARRLMKRGNIGIIIVDYLQLMRGSSKASEASRVQEISEITQGLKAIAKELNVPVMALSQLSRAVEQREDKRPLLSDLRESGSIEQDADIVMFIYREDYYLVRKQPREDTPEHEKWQMQMEDVMNLTEIIIAKHRNGPVGNVKLHFDSKTTKFVNHASVR